MEDFLFICAACYGQVKRDIIILHTLIVTDASEPSVCTSGNTTYSVGDTWWKSACVQCSCREGARVTCSPPPSCSVHCEHPVLQPGHCCPTCPQGSLLTYLIFNIH